MAITPESFRQLSLKFLDMVLGRDQEGWFCLSVCDPIAPKETWEDHYYEWPKQRQEIINAVEAKKAGRNVYFGTQLYAIPRRSKATCLPVISLWADLDTADPSKLDPRPQIVVETSPNKYHAYWTLKERLDPVLAEDYCKRLAYKYKDNGADVSGWDLSQVLRMPFTWNYKYKEAGLDPPIVYPKRGVKTPYDLHIFEQLPSVNDTKVVKRQAEVPNLDLLPSANELLAKYRRKFISADDISSLFLYAPDAEEDWSARLWRLMKDCLEAGMSAEETFVVAWESKSNKYERDGRPARHLWVTVLKAELEVNKKRANIPALSDSMLEMPELLTDTEREETIETFIDEYVQWASKHTDAPLIYHQAGGFLILSAACSGAVRIAINAYPDGLIPNLWIMILADSTLTRKTTAIELAMQFVIPLNDGIILATDGSSEGIFQGLSMRSEMPSIFWRDEVNGFIRKMNRQDYMASMMSDLTKLYDSPPLLSRRLRKETITVRRPILIFFGGGIKDKMYSDIGEDHYESGFMQRFLFVSAQTDLSQIKDLGPPEDADIKGRSAINEKIKDLWVLYNNKVTMSIKGEEIGVPPRIEAHLTEAAWKRYNRMDRELRDYSYGSGVDHATSVYTRLSVYILKLGALLSASTAELDENNRLSVTEDHIIAAASYIEQWGKHSVDILMNSGGSADERMVKRVLRNIVRKPGILKSELSRNQKLTADEMRRCLATLLDRDQIEIRKIDGKGGGEQMFPNYGRV